MVSRISATSRHPELFGSRRLLATRSRPGITKRVLYPIAYGLRDRGLLPVALHALLLRRGLQRPLRLSGGAGER